MSRTIKDKYRNANGTLTRYALSCGYMEQRSDGKKRLQLYQEYGSFHVRAFEEDTNHRIFWEVFDNGSLTKARKLFYKGKLT